MLRFPVYLCISQNACIPEFRSPSCLSLDIEMRFVETKSCIPSVYALILHNAYYVFFLLCLEPNLTIISHVLDDATQNVVCLAPRLAQRTWLLSRSHTTGPLPSACGSKCPRARGYLILHNPTARREQT